MRRQALPIREQALAETGQKPAAAAKPGASAPGFDDLMTMLVQPRHVKLYYAGSAKIGSWQPRKCDLRSSFDRIAQTIPNYEGNGVSLSIRDLIASRIDAVAVAIAAADSMTGNRPARIRTSTPGHKPRLDEVSGCWYERRYFEKWCAITH